MTTADRALNEFVDAWNAGERPRVEQYLERAPEDEREELASLLNAFLEQAPTPNYSEETLEELMQEPAVESAAGLIDSRSGLWQALLPRLRRRAKMKRAEVVMRLAELLEVKGSEGHVGRYYHQMETGNLDSGGVSRKVLEALGEIFGVAPSELEQAADFQGLSREAPAAMYFRTLDVDALTDFATAEHVEYRTRRKSRAEWDEVDRLFLGGR
jgi:hypothetical protein